ncbi:MAG: FAD-dependent oxidoreductase [Coriobacteriia bacterium]|nr:FAD-dependent oxidoreductase [Coriobacteriia bacterium]
MNSSERDREQPGRLSRRDFLMGTAIAGVAAVGTTVLAGCGASAASSQTKVTTTDPISPVGAPANWTQEADIVVVGSGGGGLAAALKATELGNSVLVLEKGTYIGGSTIEASVCYAFGTRYTDAIKFGVPSYPQDWDALVEYFMTSCDYTIDPVMFKRLCMKGAETINWLGDFGVPWALDIKGWGPTGHIWKGALDGGNEVRGVKPLVDFMYDLAIKKGVKFLMSTTVTALVTDGDRVVGIKAEDRTGNVVHMHGKKAVILAAGGFAFNRDMLKKYCPEAYDSCACATVSPCDTGECSRMALGLGAEMVGMSSVTAFEGGIDAIHDGGEWFRYLYDGSTQLARQPWLSINHTGERYPYLTSVGNPYHLVAGGIQTTIQPGRRGYVIFDDNYEEYVAATDQILCRTPIRPDMPNQDRWPEGLPNDWRVGAKAAIKDGTIKSADTLEALAAALELDTDVVVKAVGDWNALCKAGADDRSYMPAQPNWLHPVEKAPFYGIRMGSTLFSTDTGLAVTPDMQVIRKDGLPIPGLYAAYHTAGGGSGQNRWGGGPLACVNYAMAGGYMAAEGVAKQEA